MMATEKDVTPSIPLSNSTVSSRIDEMANDIENKLCDELKTTQFSLQLGETTLRDNEALVMAYVRYVNASRKIIGEFLFVEQLEVDTKYSTQRYIRQLNNSSNGKEFHFRMLLRVPMEHHHQ